MQLVYPKSDKSKDNDTFYGTQIADPYRWLENNDSLETQTWVNQQNQLTNTYLSKVKDQDKIKTRLQNLYNYEKNSAPKFIKNKAYFWYNSGQFNQSILCTSNNFSNPKKTIILDPNLLSKTDNISVDQISFSKNCQYLAYATAKNGSDWLTVSVLDLENNQTLKDNVEWLKRSNICWFKDGFFYSRLPKPSPEKLLTAKDTDHRLYYHKLGTNQDVDILIYHDPQGIEIDIRAQITSDEKYLILRRGQTEMSWAASIALLDNVTDLRNLKFKTLADSYQNSFELVDSVGDKLYFLTDFKADNNCIIEVNFNNLTQENWQTVIPKTKDKLEQALLLDNQIICNYIKNASSQLQVYNLENKSNFEIPLETIGKVSQITFNHLKSEIYYSFATFCRPTSIYKFNLDTNITTLVKQPKVDFNPNDFETKQIWYESKDGTKIPMFITHQKGLILDSNRPTWVFGYGGFNISILPDFSPFRIPFLENGGVFCLANIRGGGEFGQNWYQSATKLNKQKSYDDFINGCKYLIDNKYTNSEKLIIEGGSNGGLLVAACMTQKPDLFGIVICHVPVTDMLRFQHFTEGGTWVSDFGDINESKEQFEYILKYSPLHTTKKANYPATLVLTADHDDRVVPLHSFKFTAILQAAQTSKRPILIRIDTKSGHGGGKATSSLIAEKADILGFIEQNINSRK
jgi:prolyl oligopeptidase